MRGLLATLELENGLGQRRKALAPLVVVGRVLVEEPAVDWVVKGAVVGGLLDLR